jgi:hypothetical protein
MPSNALTKPTGHRALTTKRSLFRVGLSDSLGITQLGSDNVNIPKVSFSNIGGCPNGLLFKIRIAFFMSHGDFNS